MHARAAVLAAVLGVTAWPAFGADATNGKAVFQRCAVCHSLSAGDEGDGPSLHGLFNRKAGTEPNFAFSPAMQKSGIVWNDAALKKFLADPEAAVPGTKMKSGAIDESQTADDLIAYLKAATK